MVMFIHDLPRWSSVLAQKTASHGVLQYLQKQAVIKHREGVYSAPVVLWLVMLQRLCGVAPWPVPSSYCCKEPADPLLADCQQVRRKRIPSQAGGYCQARQKLPKLLCEQVSQEIVERRRVLLNADRPDGKADVFALLKSSAD